MENKREASGVTDSNSRVDSLMQRIEEILGVVTVEANKEIVAFVGPTKSGKSTLINCLLGSQLMCMRDDCGETILLKAPDAPGPKIGRTGESETEVPVCYQNVPDTNFGMWDFAGFGDNKGTEQEIVNAISYHSVLFSQNVRFVLVVPDYVIKADNPFPFYTLLCELQKICPQIADSLCIVSTKGHITVKKLLNKAKSHTFPNVDKSILAITECAKTIIERVLKNETYVDFKAPLLEEDVDEESFTLTNKQEFIDCIKKLKGTEVSDFPLVISSQGKLDIAELYSVFYQEVNRDVKKTISLIKEYTGDKIVEIMVAKEGNGKPTSAAQRLDRFKSEKSTIKDVIEKSKDFKTFFVQVKDIRLEIEDTFTENITKFCFIEGLKNSYKIGEEKSAKRELEFFASIELALNMAERKYSDLIANSEAASEEERRKEAEYLKLQNDKIMALKDQISNLKKDNDSILVKIAMYLANTRFAEMAKEAADYVKRAFS